MSDPRDPVVYLTDERPGDRSMRLGLRVVALAERLRLLARIRLVLRVCMVTACVVMLVAVVTMFWAAATLEPETIASSVERCRRMLALIHALTMVLGALVVTHFGVGLVRIRALDAYAKASLAYADALFGRAREGA